MSGSYYNLQQKYLTILALESQSNSDPNLQDVITVSPNLDGIAPTSGQAITYDGTDVVWGDVATTTPNLQDVITVSPNLDGIAPTSGQAITYDGTDVVWGDVTTTTPNLQQVTNISGVTTNDIRINNIADTTYNEITPTSILLSGGITIADPLPNVYIKTTVGNALSYMECYKDGTGIHAGMTVQLGDNYVKTTDQSLKITTNTVLKTQLDQSQLQFFGAGTGSLNSNTLFLDDGTNSISIEPTDIQINSVSGVVGQVLGYSPTGINWVDLPPVDIPTLQQITEVSGGNITTESIILQTGSYTNTITDLGMTIVDNLTLIPSAEYTYSGITLNQVAITDNIVINPSIVLNTTEDGGVDSGIQSNYASTTNIGFINSFKVVHNMVGLTPTLTQTLNEDLGSPFNYNKNEQTPTNITLSSSLYADQQSLNILTGLTTNQIQSSSGNLQVISATDFAGVVSFNSVDSPPHCDAVPQFGNDLTNKLYVDTKVIASGGGQQMYFNQSVPSLPLPYKSLGTSIVVAPQQTLITSQLNPVLGTPQKIAEFITEPFYPNVGTIPAGIWTANIYGKVSGGTAGSLYYMLKVYTIDVLNSTTLLGTGTGIVDVDATGLDIVLYSVSTTIDTVIGVNLSDRILVEILTDGIANAPASTLTTYFQDGTYSFLTTPLISGTNLLGLNNSWTGTNTFAVQPITTAIIPAYPTTTPSNGLVTSTWVKNAINYAEKGKITSASVPALAVTGTLNFANTYTTIPLVLLTVDMGSGTVIVSCALAGTTLTTFNYILSSLSGVSSLNYYVIVI